jgi:hypothetical protein
MSRKIWQLLDRRLWKSVKAGVITEEYRKLERKVKNMIRSAKRKMKNLADGGSKKSFYAYIKRKTKSRTSVDPLKTGSEGGCQGRD